MSAKGQPTKKPKLAGVDYQDFTTAEGDQPHTYFAGARKLPVAWIMPPIISQVKATPSSSAKGK